MSGPGPFVPPTYGWDPSRPHSAQFWMAPELRRPSWDRPPDRNVVSGVPVDAQGNYPGTPAYPVGEAGETRAERLARARGILEETRASGPQQFDFARDYMKRFLSFYGAADENVAQLDLADWNDSDNLTAAVESLRYQLEDICRVNWTETPWPSFGAMWESRGGFGDRSWESIRALISKFCPAFSFRDEPAPPPPMMVTATGSEVMFEDVPPDAPPPQKFVPAPPETFVPTDPVPFVPTTAITATPYKAPRKYPKMGYWVGGSALILVVLGGAWYLSRRKPRRRSNPSRRKNLTMGEHTYEHGFLEGFDAAEKAFTKSNPCNCPPTPRTNPRRRSAPKRRKNSYSGKIQHPSPQYDVMGYARTPVLQDFPGATWEPPARPNPRRRKRRKSAPKKRSTSKKRSSKKHPNFSGAICGRRFGKLTSRRRDALPSSAFGLPRSRQYPMPDSSHAANAKARATAQLNRKNLSKSQYNQIVRKADRILKQCKR